MGDRVYGWAMIGPWDRDVVSTSEEGRALLAAIELIDFEDGDEIDDAGVRLLSLSDGQCNYGTMAFEDDGLVEKAVAAGLWIAVGDDGSVDWDPHHEVHAPSGESYGFLGEPGSAVVGSDFLARVEAECGGAAAVAFAKVKEHLELGNRSLGQWIAAAQVAASS